jgi:uncharacterized membrane protein YwaF
MAGNEPLDISDSEREARRTIRAAMIGIIMLVVGLMLALSNFVIYIGAWPDERPFYLGGIGVIMSIIGFIALAAGLIMSWVFSHEASVQAEAPGR